MWSSTRWRTWAAVSERILQSEQRILPSNKQHTAVERGNLATGCLRCAVLNNHNQIVPLRIVLFWRAVLFLDCGGILKCLFKTRLNIAVANKQECTKGHCRAARTVDSDDPVNQKKKSRLERLLF